MIKTASKNKSGFFLEVRCPGCGADLELEDSYFVLNCSFCDLNLRVVKPDAPLAYLAPDRIDKRKGRIAIDRYLKSRDLPLTNSDYQLKQVYYPYWKIDAVLFKVRKRRETRIVSSEYDFDNETTYEKETTEISLIPYSTTLSGGIKFDGLPETIGLRSNYIKLAVFADENRNQDFDVLPLTKSWEATKAGLDQNIHGISMTDINQFGVNKTELFFPRASVIYFPFLVYDFYDEAYNRYVIDGISGRMVNHITQLDFDNSLSDSGVSHMEFGGLVVEAHNCRNCGGKLPNEQSYVYLCRNCQSLETTEKMLFELNRILYCPHPNHNHEGETYVPFWSFKLPPEIVKQIQPMIGGIYKSDRLVVPAFKVANIDAMFKLTKRISAAWPQFDPVELTNIDGDFRPVNMKPLEALLYADIFIYKDDFVKGRAHKNGFSFKPEGADLVYLPFERESYFYIDSILKAVTFEKNLLS